MLCAVVAILSVMAMPAFLSYYHSASLKAGAQQVFTLVNQARELAIKQNQDVCVKLPTATQMTYVLVVTSPCTGSVWVGAGTDAAGNANLPTGITATASADPVFTYVGSLRPPPSAVTYTLTNTQTGAALKVLVAASGRICIAPAASSACP